MTPVPRTPQQRLLPTTRTFLLVEGDDEVRVVSAADPQRPDRVVHDARGQGNLLKATDTLLLAPEFGRIDNFGLVLDAEEDPTNATALAREVLRRLGCPSYAQHAQGYSSAGKRWGFFLLPDGASKGALESLLRRALDPNAQSATCADAWEQYTNVARPNRAQTDKAWLRVAAATAPKVREGWPQLLGKPDGILLDHPTLDPLRSSLQDLG